MSPQKTMKPSSKFTKAISKFFIVQFINEKSSIPSHPFLRKYFNLNCC